MIRSLPIWFLVVVTCLVTAEAAHAQAEGDKKKEEERAKAVAAVKKLAESQWDGILPGRQPIHKETEHFLLYGSVEEKQLESIAKSAENAFSLCSRVLKITPDDELWPGKMVVHVFGGRAEFASFSRRHANRSPERDETGGFGHEREHSYVMAGPPGFEVRRFSLETEVVQNVASATLIKKAGRKPNWFVSGFGRSVAYRTFPQQFRQERSLATSLVRNGRTAWNVWKGELSAEEGAVLNASFVDFLVHSPAMSKNFATVLSNLGEDSMFDDVLKSSNLNPDAVALAWVRWVPTAR
ncbi:MAG: hypothetical protein NZM31_13805 [Gemmatales bacterium]|nr:hypothetical protein [Gemmatales bacterium]MDW8388070.1 hypothetical protein [Gemmatales bacterium]